MLFDPRSLLEYPLEILAVVAIIVIGKSPAATLIVLALRRPLRPRFRCRIMGQA